MTHPAIRVPRRPTPPVLLVATFCALVLIWGTTWAAIRVGLRGIPPLTGVAIRFALARGLLLALAPVFGVRLGRHPTSGGCG